MTITHKSSIGQLEQVFGEMGITTAYPGFYDEPAFVAAESQSPEFLETYAKYVQDRTYDPEYIARARREIPTIARVLYGELVADGRKGACIDLSMMLSRILEREGFWNYMVRGGLTITFPVSAQLKAQYFWDFDVREDGIVPQAGHAWVVAPPFAMVDLTLKQQPYRHGVQHIPDYVLEEQYRALTPKAEDILSPEVRAVLAAHGVGRRDMVRTLAPGIPALWKTFPPVEVEVLGSRFKYTPTGISGCVQPLEGMTGWPVNGRLAVQVHQQLVAPALAAQRATD